MALLSANRKSSFSVAVPGAPPSRRSAPAAGRRCSGCARRRPPRTSTRTTATPNTSAKRSTAPKPARHHRFRRGRRLRRRRRDGRAVARLPRRAHRAGQGTAALGAGGVAGQGPRAGHQHADVADRRRGAARPPGRHPGRAEHRPRGRRGLRGRGGAGDARPAPGRAARAVVPHQAFSRLHHRRRGRRRDGRRVEERLRDRGRDGLFAGYRREHPGDGDRPLGARDVQAGRGDGRAARHVRRAGRHGRPDRHLHQPAQPQPARRRATGSGKTDRRDHRRR